MILRDPTGAAPPTEPVEQAVALFAARTWPGEALSAEERGALARHARGGMGTGETDGEGWGTAGADGPGGVDRRMGAALDVARRTRRSATRRLAKCGALRPCTVAARPGGRAWSLDLSPMTDGCALELGAYRRLREALEGIADLWDAGDRPVLVLRGLGGWPGAAGGPSGVKAYCESVLHRLGAGRGWCGDPEVLRSGLS